MTIDDDFLKTIQSSQELPDLPSDIDDRIPDILSGFGNAQPLISKITDPTGAQVPGAKQFEFTFHCARLVIGKQSEGYDQGKELFTEVDESAQLKEIMDMHLRGRALIHCKKETFLKDGTVVVWIEWMEPKKETPPIPRGYLNTDELLSPVHSSDTTTTSSSLSSVEGEEGSMWDEDL